MQIFKRDFMGEDRIFSISFRIIFPIDESLYFNLVFGNLKYVKTGSSYGLLKLMIYTRPLAKLKGIAKQK